MVSGDLLWMFWHHPVSSKSSGSQPWLLQTLLSLSPWPQPDISCFNQGHHGHIWSNLLRTRYTLVKTRYTLVKTWYALANPGDFRDFLPFLAASLSHTFTHYRCPHYHQCHHHHRHHHHNLCLGDDSDKFHEWTIIKTLDDATHTMPYQLELLTQCFFFLSENSVTLKKMKHSISLSGLFKLCFAVF